MSPRPSRKRPGRVVQMPERLSPPMLPSEVAWTQAEEVAQTLVHLVQQHANVTAIELTMAHLAKRLRQAEGLEL